MKMIYFLLILFSSTCYSQTSISLYVGVNPHSNLLRSDNLDSYWKPGVTFGVSGEMFLSNAVSISPSFEYGSYQFDSYWAWVSFPEIRLISSSGSVSTMWRTFAEVRFFTEKGGMSRFYLLTGVGFIVEHIGTINATYSALNGPDYIEVIHPESRDFFVHTLGAGVRWNIVSQIAIDLKAQYFTNYNDRMYTTVRMGVLYTLSD